MSVEDVGVRECECSVCCAYVFVNKTCTSSHNHASTLQLLNWLHLGMFIFFLIDCKIKPKPKNEAWKLFMQCGHILHGTWWHSEYSVFEYWFFFICVLLERHKITMSSVGILFWLSLVLICLASIEKRKIPPTMFILCSLHLFCCAHFLSIFCVCYCHIAFCSWKDVFSPLTIPCSAASSVHCLIGLERRRLPWELQIQWWLPTFPGWVIPVIWKLIL